MNTILNVIAYQLKLPFKNGKSNEITRMTNLRGKRQMKWKPRDAFTVIDTGWQISKKKKIQIKTIKKWLRESNISHFDLCTAARAPAHKHTQYI